MKYKSISIYLNCCIERVINNNLLSNYFLKCGNNVILFENYVTLIILKVLNFVRLLFILFDLISFHTIFFKNIFIKIWFYVITILKVKIMNLKRIFGGLLTVLGIGSLIYAAVVFMSNSGGNRYTKSLIIFGILGLIFFVAGISLIRTTKDEA